MATFRKRGGSWQVQVRRGEHSTASKTFPTKREALEWARSVESKIDQGIRLPSRTTLSSVTLGQIVLRYMEDIVPNKRSPDNELISLNAFLREPICLKSLDKITSADFLAYRDKKLKEISGHSLKRYLSPLKNMLEIAKTEWGICFPYNPLDSVKVQTIDNRRQRRLHSTELERLTKAAKLKKNLLILPIIRIALETGMRRGEILSLTWSDIDLQRRVLTIQKSKNGSKRLIPLSRVAIEIFLSLPERDEKVFAITSVALRQAWDRLTKAVGIVDLRFHDLRHEAISRFFECGLTVPEVALLSGHRDIRMLMRYAHANMQVTIAKLDQRTTDCEIAPECPGHDLPLPQGLGVVLCL